MFEHADAGASVTLKPREANEGPGRPRPPERYFQGENRLDYEEILVRVGVARIVSNRLGIGTALHSRDEIPVVEEAS